MNAFKLGELVQKQSKYALDSSHYQGLLLLIVCLL